MRQVFRFTLFGSTLASLILLYIPAHASLSITRLRCEGLSNPLGIDVTTPVFNWEMESPARDERQTAYQLIVSLNRGTVERGKGDVWNSGKVVSDQSAWVEYRGARLHSGRTYYWRVRVWDREGRVSAWSPIAFWSMGLLDPDDWKARWIGYDGDLAGDSSQAEHRPLAGRMLRREFSLNKPIKSAYAYVCGLGLFELLLNGKKVGDHVLAPGATQYDKKAFYVTYDVTDYLKKGSNAAGVMLGNGRYYAMRRTQPVPMVTYGYPKLLLQIQVEFRDGSVATIISDDQWKFTADGPIRRNNEYDGEVYDARREMQGWAAPGYDDSRWAPVMLVGPGAPRLEAQKNEPIRVTDHIRPVSVTPLRPGAYIVDMGQNMVGWVRLTVNGMRGTSVAMRFAETLDRNGDLYTANLRSARQTDTYILKGSGTEVYEPRFTYHGFRYVEITGYPGVPDQSTLLGCVVHDDIQWSGSFQSSNALLNQIFKNTSWGIRGNYRSMPTDCPQRDERHGWLGDRAIESGGESYLFDVSRLYAKWLDDIRDAQLEDGSLPDLAPSYWPFYNDNVTWGGTYLIIPHMLYRHFGDRRVIERHYPTMKKWLAHMDRYMVDGIMPRDTYGDWCVPPELPHLIHTEDPARMTDGAFIGSAYYCYILRLMSEYAVVLDDPGEAQEFSRRADSLRANINRKFFDAGRKRYVNGTVTSTLLGLAFNLVPEEDRETLFQNLASRVLTADAGHVATGLIGCQWLCRTLTNNGRPDIAYTLLNEREYPSLGYMIDKGATTIWELWNGDMGDPGMNSQNHVMLTGDLAIWLFENVAGISPAAGTPGFKRMAMRPVMISDLSSVDATYHSTFGIVGSRWRLTDNEFSWQVDIPANATAEISIPVGDSAQVTESGKAVSRVDGVQVLRREQGYLVCQVGSGRYTFASKGVRARVPAPVVARNDRSGLVSMSVSDETAEIRYTIDGRTPDTASSLYTTPFLHLQHALITARASSSAGESSAVTVARLDQRRTPEPSIVIERPVVEHPGTSLIEIHTEMPGDRIHFTLDGSEPTVSSAMYTEPVSVDRTTTVRAIAISEGSKPSPSVETVAAFTIPRREVTLTWEYSPKYPGGGTRALIDGRTGPLDYRDPAWQGFEGTDMEAIIDLGKASSICDVTIGFLQNQGSWIFPPIGVECAVSLDGASFAVVADEQTSLDSTVTRASIIRKHVRFSEVTARFIKVRARNVGLCPPWHNGAGGKAWLFVDEISVE